MLKLNPEQSFIPAASSSEPVPEPLRWTFGARLAFRFAFCYFLLYALCCGNVTLWNIIPRFGATIEYWLAWPFLEAGQWLARHWLHIQGVGTTLQNSGSSDSTIHWIAVGIIFTVALLATLLWTALDYRSLAYPRHLGWFRLILRLTLGYAMLTYGLAKFFPLQMSPPSLAVLNEPFGNLAPKTLLWTMIGLNPLYETICGAAEILGGTLILFRRTALAGAMLLVFLTANIVLDNLFFDVPVKIYAIHLLLMSVIALVPDLRALFGFYWLHQPIAPTVPWAPWRNRIIPRLHITIETLAIILCLLLPACITASQFAQAIQQQHAKQLHPAPLTGQWRVDSATLNNQSHPYLTGNGLHLTDLFLEPSGHTMLRDTSTTLWRSGARIDEKKHTLRLSSDFKHPVVYTMTEPDPIHLILTPTGEDATTEATLHLTRVPLPSHYPLLDRGFHWVNEWGLER